MIFNNDFASLFTAVSLALAVSSSPVVIRDNMVTLPFTMGLNNSDLTIADIDRARAQQLKNFIPPFGEQDSETETHSSSSQAHPTSQAQAQNNQAKSNSQSFSVLNTAVRFKI